jgi:hypothetical protein
MHQFSFRFASKSPFINSHELSSLKYNQDNDYVWAERKMSVDNKNWFIVCQCVCMYAPFTLLASEYKYYDEHC